MLHSKLYDDMKGFYKSKMLKNVLIIFFKHQFHSSNALTSFSWYVSMGILLKLKG